MIFNILDNTTELWMTKYIIGEIFSSGGATLYKNPSDQSVWDEFWYCILPSIYNLVTFIQLFWGIFNFNDLFYVTFPQHNITSLPFGSQKTCEIKGPHKHCFKTLFLFIQWAWKSIVWLLGLYSKLGLIVVYIGKYY